MLRFRYIYRHLRISTKWNTGTALVTKCFPFRERGVERALPTTALDFDSVMQQKTLYKHLELNK